VLSVLSADLVAPLSAAMRTARFSSVSVRDGDEVDLTALVSTEFLKIVDELKGLHGSKAVRAGRLKWNTLRELRHQIVLCSYQKGRNIGQPSGLRVVHPLSRVRRREPNGHSP
jgi:hypothetical protein